LTAFSAILPVKIKAARMRKAFHILFRFAENRAFRQTPLTRKAREKG
jgi:hypothetical protein